MPNHERMSLAKLIYSMPYGELMAVAKELSDMIDADVRPQIKTQQEFAEALYDWAEATASDS